MDKTKVGKIMCDMKSSSFSLEMKTSNKILLGIAKKEPRFVVEDKKNVAFKK